LITTGRGYKCFQRSVEIHLGEESMGQAIKRLKIRS
jgi:hypothetical protein